MAHARLTFLLPMLLALLPSVAWAGLCGIRQPCPTGGGTTITTEATWADLQAGGCTSDGDIGYTEDQDLYWVCNGATGLWLPPEVQPASIDIADYTAAALPAASTPAWTRVLSGDGQSEAVAGGELTLTDGGTGYLYYTLTDSDIAAANNVAILARMKLTATDGNVDAAKVWMALNPGTAYVGIYSFETGMTGGGLSRADNVCPIGSSWTYSQTLDSPDNAAYQWYLITWTASTYMFSMRALGDGPIFRNTRNYFGTSISPGNNSVGFGAKTVYTTTSVWDRVMVFTY